MKRVLAIIFAASILFSAACGKKETETSKTKKTTESPEITETEPSESEEPTDTEPTDTEPTDDYQDVTDVNQVRTYAGPVSVHCVNDLTRVNYKISHYTDHFHVDGSDAYAPEITLSLDTLTITDPGYEELQKTIDAIQKACKDDLQKEYEKEVERLKGLPDGDYSDTYGDNFTSYIEVIRCDSLILSFTIQSNITFKKYTYAIDTQTGRQLEYSDIIKDMDAFIELVDLYAEDLHYTDDFDDSGKAREEKFRELRHKQLREFELGFALQYDGITIFLDDQGEFFYNADVAKISAMTDQQIFNMDYFGHTPEYYVLIPNSNGWLYWDFDDDGILDKLGSEKTVLEPLPLGFSDIEIGSFDVLPAASTWSFSFYRYVRSDDGRYLYIPPRGAEVHTDFAMESLDLDDAVYYFLPTHPCDDPACYEVTESVDFLGYRTMYRTFSIIGTGGIPRSTSAYYDKENFAYSSKTDIQGYAYDPDTKTKGDSITIPKGSGFDIIEYDLEKESAVFLITPPGVKDHSKDYYVQVICSGFKDTERNGGEIGGVRQSDAFDGLPSYGG